MKRGRKIRRASKTQKVLDILKNMEVLQAGKPLIIMVQQD